MPIQCSDQLDDQFDLVRWVVLIGEFGAGEDYWPWPGIHRG